MLKPPQAPPCFAPTCGRPCLTTNFSWGVQRQNPVTSWLLNLNYSSRSMCLPSLVVGPSGAINSVHAFVPVKVTSSILTNVSDFFKMRETSNVPTLKGTSNGGPVWCLRCCLPVNESSVSEKFVECPPSPGFDKWTSEAGTLTKCHNLFNLVFFT